MSDWSPDGRRIAFDFVDDTGVHIATMDPDGRHVRQLTSGRGIQGDPKWSPDGRWIAFGRITGVDAQGAQLEAVYVVRTDGSGVRRVVPPTAGLEHPDWSPDGRWISYNIDPLAPSPAVLKVHPDGTGLRVIRRQDEHFELFKPRWSPDGRKFLVGCYEVAAAIDRICVMDADGRNLHIVVATDDPLNYPAWGSLAPSR
ncbi:hypothetical protein [Kribbella sp. NPDC000426]|uniref:TolB family protein n=1 Tax=Kribbella sp. NPDC000426 TaxID=3154255 RepID=UPI00331651ED